MSIKLKLPLMPTHPLVKWANQIRGFYGHPVLLVGSQVTGKENPRDVDVVCAIPDEEFELRYGNVSDWMKEGDTGQWTKVRWIWADDCAHKSLDGMRDTKLQIDFKVQPMTLFDGYKNINKTFPPYKIDTRKT